MSTTNRIHHHAPRLVAAALLCVGATMGVAAGPANATTDQVCGPLTSGKIDTSGDPKTVTVTLSDEDIAAGKVITGYCVKAGSASQTDGGPVYVTLDPPVTTITFEHPSGKDVSHYSYSVGVTTTPTTPTETPTTPVETPTTPVETPTTPVETPTTPVETPTTPVETQTPEVLPETETQEETPEVLGEQASSNNNTPNQQQPQAQPQAQPQSQQSLPTAVNAGASPVQAPVSGTDSLLAMLLVLLGAVSARLGWTRARG